MTPASSPCVLVLVLVAVLALPHALAAVVSEDEAGSSHTKRYFENDIDSSIGNEISEDLESGSFSFSPDYLQNIVTPTPPVPASALVSTRGDGTFVNYSTSVTFLLNSVICLVLAAMSGEKTGCTSAVFWWITFGGALSWGFLQLFPVNRSGTGLSIKVFESMRALCTLLAGLSQWLLVAWTCSVPRKMVSLFIAVLYCLLGLYRTIAFYRSINTK